MTCREPERDRAHSMDSVRRDYPRRTLPRGGARTRILAGLLARESALEAAFPRQTWRSGGKLPRRPLQRRGRPGFAPGSLLARPLGKEAGTSIYVVQRMVFLARPHTCRRARKGNFRHSGPGVKRQFGRSQTCATRRCGRAKLLGSHKCDNNNNGNMLHAFRFSEMRSKIRHKKREQIAGFLQRTDRGLLSPDARRQPHPYVPTTVPSVPVSADAFHEIRPRATTGTRGNSHRSSRPSRSFHPSRD